MDAVGNDSFIKRFPCICQIKQEACTRAEQVLHDVLARVQSDVSNGKRRKSPWWMYNDTSRPSDETVYWLQNSSKNVLPTSGGALLKLRPQIAGTSHLYGISGLASLSTPRGVPQYNHEQLNAHCFNLTPLIRHISHAAVCNLITTFLFHWLFV